MNWEKFTQREEILKTWDDDEGLLKSISAPLTAKIEEEENFWELLMEYTLHNERCLGMAGVQIGLPYQGFYLAINGLGEFRFRNPEILRQSERMLVFKNEGCMSDPETYIDTLRPAWIHLRDEINGEMEYSGLLGTCIIHEMDHLNGIRMNEHKAPPGWQPIKVGRNDPCPDCIEAGSQSPPKLKKCAMHYK